MTEDYKTLELLKWKKHIQVTCKARMDDEWIRNTCKITDRYCNKNDCFALQIILCVKGYI